MNEKSLPGRSKLELSLGAFVGFYRPGVEEARRLDPVSKFLYPARSVIPVMSGAAGVLRPDARL